MTEKDFITSYAVSENITKKESDIRIKNFIKHLNKFLVEEEEVYLRSFGKFKVSKVAAREGTHPKTQEKISIPARKKISFSASKTIKEELNPKT